MYPEYAPAETAIKHEGHDESDSRLHGRWLLLARVIWGAMFVLVLTLFVASIPGSYASLRTIVPHDYLRQLEALGLSVDFVTTYVVALNIAFACCYIAVAGLLFWHKSDDRMALFASITLVTFVITFSQTVSLLPQAWQLPVQFVGFLGSVCIGLLFYLFPTGRFVPRWTRWVSVGVIVYWGAQYFFRLSPFNPFTRYPVLDIVTFVSFIGTMLVAQVYRYRRVSSPIQRQQTKWVVFGTTVALLGFTVVESPNVLLAPHFPPSLLSQLIVVTAINCFVLLIPLSLGFAILHSRLWDIDIIINRTLVYGALTGTLALIYVSLVIGLQYLLRLFSVQASSLALVGSTLAIAAIFQPLRRRLQRTINRLMYGERDDPYAVLTRLGKRLEATLASDTVLPTIVETVAQTLKLAYVAITLAPDERRPTPDQASPSEDSFVPVATYGSPTAHPLLLPLIYQVETIGHLLIGPRPGETLTSANHRLLADLARQIGISAHSVQLTAELQQARERLVLTREEERRRLRRDLHDGLGPQLASQALTLTAARKLLRDDPDAAETLLVDATAHAQEAITDIRRLVYALRPPALDDLGLVAVLREQAAQYGSSGVAIILEAPEQLPPLPAAVEVACYRILQETLTNVVRHAHSHNCTIRLFVNESLCLEVTDDGDGLPTAYRAGVGLTSMRERAKELGGTCVIDRVTGGGTRVCAQLPLL